MIRLASKMGLTIRSHRRTSSTRAVVFAATLFLCLFHLTKSEGQSCGPGWCNTFPVSGSLSGRQTPPFGSSAWNKLTYVPDADRFFIFSSDGIWTFSNAWWSYGVMGHVAASNPWIEESTSGTIQSTVTDNSKGFLKAAIGSADTVITLEKGEGATFHPDPDHGGVLVIDDEEIGYTSAGRSEDKFTEVRRGIRGTTAASHTARTLVNAGAPAPQSRIQGKLIAVNDHIPDRHPFLTSTYDSRRHQLFQAGGILEGNKKTDTWYFCFVENEFCPKGDVRVWKRLLTKTPVPGRADAAMTYDSDDDVVIWYGGQNFGSPIADTWLLCFHADPQEGGNKVGCPASRVYPDWVQVAAGGNSAGPRFTHSIVYDSYHHKAILFGGMNGSGTDPNETWIYNPGARAWTNAKPSGDIPSGFRRPAMAYDSTRHRVVLYEGPLGKITDGVSGGLYLYDAGANKWELTSVQGGPIPSSPPDVAAHGRLSLDYNPEADVFVATELSLPYSLQVWELKGSALRPREVSQPAAKPGQE